MVGVGRGGGGGRGQWGWRWGELVEEDAALDGLAADGTLAHSVAAQLAGAVAAQEDHVLQPVQAHRAHGLVDTGTGRQERRGVTVMSAKKEGKNR